MLLVAVETARAEPVASPKNSRIALRYSTARVLIVGGVLEAGSDATIKELRGIQKPFPKLENADQVGGAWMNVVPPQLARRWKPEPVTEWHIGDQWQLYPGAGAPAALVIEKIVILGHPGEMFGGG